MTPLIVILVLLEVDLDKSHEDELNELLLGVVDIVFQGLSLLLPFELIFSQGGPELVGLGSHSVTGTLGSLLSDLADLLEVELEGVVLVRCHLSQALEGALLDVLIWDRAGQDYLVHYCIPLSGNLEVVLGVRDTVGQGLDGELGGLKHLRLIRHILNQGLYDHVLMSIGEVLGVELVANVSKSGQRGHSDVHIGVVRVLA